MLSDALIRELQQIVKEEFNLDLDIKEASELGNSLVNCYSLLIDEEGAEK